MYLQYWLLFVICVSFLENFLSSFDYLVYNETGKINLGFNVIYVLLSVTKRTASYIALILVTSGVTLTRPTLNVNEKRLLIGFSVGYVIISAIYQFLNTLSYTPTGNSNIPESAIVLFLILATIYDFLWLLWVFRSLFNTLLLLQKKKQTEKLQIFKKLSWVILTFYFVSFILFISQMSLLLDDKYDKIWDSYWLFEAYWTAIYFIITVVIGVLWRPNPNTSRYAYSSQLGDGPSDSNINNGTELTDTSNSYPSPSNSDSHKQESTDDVHLN